MYDHSTKYGEINSHMHTNIHITHTHSKKENVHTKIHAIFLKQLTKEEKNEKKEKKNK